jgi:hypothetical protein
MKPKCTAACLAIAVVAALVCGAEAEENQRLTRVSLELSDGTRLVGVPVVESLPAVLSFAEASIPLSELRKCELGRRDGAAVLVFNNGDRLTAKLKLRQFELTTAVGPLAPELSLIRSMSFSTYRAGEMPPGDGELPFGGVNWQGWRTQFEQIDDALVSLPKPRPGFNYGHGGNGRGPLLATNVGSGDWKDYSLQFDFCVMGVDPSFNPYGLGEDYHDGAIMFHVADAKESFNERGQSAYILSVHGDGTWELTSTYNDYCDQQVGWGNPRNDSQRTLAKGAGLSIDRELGNKYRIDVSGPRIQVWIDGKPIVDLVDDTMQKTIGGQTLDHGGVALQGGFDAMFWVKNFSAQPLRAAEPAVRAND